MKTKDRRGKSAKMLESHSSQKVAVRSQKASSASRRTISPLAGQSQAMQSSKVTERSLNVYENKRSARKESERSLNVLENKGTYTLLCYI
jgi:hypothetical protein